MNARIMTSLLLTAATLSGVAGCGFLGAKANSDRRSFPSRQPPQSPYTAALDGGVIARAGLHLTADGERQALRAEYKALETSPVGQPVIWSNGRTVGEVVAAAPYQVGDQNCRQYRHTVTTGNRTLKGSGTACRNADGIWTLLK